VALFTLFNFYGDYAAVARLFSQKSQKGRLFSESGDYAIFLAPIWRLCPEPGVTFCSAKKADGELTLCKPGFPGIMSTWLMSTNFFVTGIFVIGAIIM